MDEVISPSGGVLELQREQAERERREYLASWGVLGQQQEQPMPKPYDPADLAQLQELARRTRRSIDILRATDESALRLVNLDQRFHYLEGEIAALGKSFGGCQSVDVHALVALLREVTNLLEGEQQS